MTVHVARGAEFLDEIDAAVQPARGSSFVVKGIQESFDKPGPAPGACGWEHFLNDTHDPDRDHPGTFKESLYDWLGLWPTAYEPDLAAIQLDARRWGLHFAAWMSYYETLRAFYEGDAERQADINEAITHQWELTTVILRFEAWIGAYRRQLRRDAG